MAPKCLKRTLCRWGARFFTALTFMSILLMFCGLAQPPSGKREADFISTEPTLVLGELHAIAIGGERLYALYASNEVAQAYTLEGEYLYTICLPTDGGMASIFAEGDDLYLKTHRNDAVYHFRQDAWVGAASEPIPVPEGGKTLLYRGDRYAIEGVDVVRIDASGVRRTVIDRPGWLCVFGESVTWSLGFASAVAVFVLDRLAGEAAERKADA